MRWTVIVLQSVALLWLTYQSVRASWRVTSRDLNDPVCLEVGEYARQHLPENAVLLCEDRTGYDHLSIMFYADRTCYTLRGKHPDEMARPILEAGGAPYIATYRRLPFPKVHESANNGLTIYLWEAKALP